jgi:hypothetical protein
VFTPLTIDEKATGFHLLDEARSILMGNRDQNVEVLRRTGRTPCA